MARVKSTCKISTLRAGAINHVINKDIPLSFIKVKKSLLTYDADGSILKAQESVAKKWPMVSFEAKMVDNPNQNLQMVVYGDAVSGLLSMEAEDTGDDLLMVGSYDHASNKWSASTALLDEAEDYFYDFNEDEEEAPVAPPVQAPVKRSRR
jgi:hypothetical protein